MPTDPRLLADVRSRLSGLTDVQEKRITGGTGFMWRGNLLCGVQRDELLVRVDKAQGAELAGEDASYPMTMGGRSSTGWLLVPVPESGSADVISRWLARGLEHARTLPAK